MSLRVASAVVAILIAAPATWADQVRVVKRGDARLHGLRAVDVYVHSILADGIACGLTVESLQAAAVTALRKRGIGATISEKASSWFNTVHVEAQTLRADGGCITSLNVDLTTHVEAIPDADRYAAADAWGSLLVGELSLARRSGLTSSTRDQHRRAVGDALADHVTAIGERIGAANQ
jgi:hypothetical protein